MVTATPYDETKIVTLLTEIYKLQQALCYYPDDSCVVYASPSGHQIDEAACEHLSLSPAVISLMKKISYPKDYEDVAYSYPFVNHSTVIVYTEAQCIVSGRDPENHGLGEALRMDLLKPTELVSTFARRDGVNILLNTEESTYLNVSGEISMMFDKD
jgi:hypothetical protein